MGANYEQVGSSKDVTNVNPNTQAWLDKLSNELNFLKSTGGVGDPNASLAAFIGAGNDLTSLAMGTASPLVQNQLGLADLLSKRSVQNTLEAAVGSGVLYGGGTARAATEAASVPYQQALGQILGAQTQLAGTTLGIGGQLIGDAYSGNRQLYGQLFATGASLAAPEWYEPTYYDKNAGWRELGGAVVGGAVSGLTGGIFGGGSLGASQVPIPQPSRQPTYSYPSWMYQPSPYSMNPWEY